MHFANDESFWTFVLYFSIVWVLVGVMLLPMRRTLSGVVSMIGHNHPKLGTFLVFVCWVFWPVAPWACEFSVWLGVKLGILED